MRGVILTSHGLLADGMLDTVKMFTNQPKQIESLCLLPEEDITVFMDKLYEKVDEVDTGEGVVVFCDLLFGTPCNCSAKLFGDSHYSARVHVVTGMNLPMILEFVGMREVEMSSEKLIKTGQDGIVDFNVLYELRNVKEKK